MLILIAAAGLQAGAGGPVHAGSPAQALEDADDGSGNFDLPGIGAMAGAGRVEWCMLCQLSPSESMAGGHKLVAQSWRRVVNGRVPITWHSPMLHDGQAQQAARQADGGGSGIGAQQHGTPSRSGRPRCPDPGTARRLVPALAVIAGRQGSAQMVVRLMSLPSSMRWPGTS